MLQFKVDRAPIRMTVKKRHIHMTVTKASVISGIKYEGDYEITPSTEKQVLPTQYKTFHENLVINPIPSEYGLVTYNQDKTLTVS